MIDQPGPVMFLQTALQTEGWVGHLMRIVYLQTRKLQLLLIVMYFDALYYR